MYNTINKTKKIQALLTNHLMRCGSVELLLPDGVVVEISITQDGKHGKKIVDDYCFVKTSRAGNSTMLDAYNLGLEYVDDKKALVCLDSTFDDVGRPMKRMDVI